MNTKQLETQGGNTRPKYVPLVALFVLILASHAWWEARNDMPPVWDMAYHQLQGWKYLEAWRSGQVLASFYQLSSYYPPLYYLQESFFLWILSDNQFLALLSNLCGLFLLSFATCCLAFRFLNAPTAVVAGVLPLLFPLVAWTSRTSLLDVSLAGWVAAGGYLVLRSDFLQNRNTAYVLGAVCAAGSLTKWTFALFLVFPVLYALIQSPNRKRSTLNLVSVLALASPAVLWWYLPNLGLLWERFQLTSQASQLEGDPGLMSVLGWVYYPRSLCSYYLHLPLTLVFVRGWIDWMKKRRSDSTVTFLWCWVGGSLLLLTSFGVKDPRYVMPLAGPLGVLLVVPFNRRTGWVYGIFLIASLQYVTVSFDTPLHPLKVALFGVEDDLDYRAMRQEWVLYQTHYFEVAGPPRRENWRHEEILSALGNARLVGFVPDLAFFHPVGLQLQAVKKGVWLEVERVGNTLESVQALSSFDFVVGKTGGQGISYITRFNKQAYEALEREAWPLRKVWDLPDASQAMLWQNPAPRSRR